MPRVARIVVPGQPHHVTQRGNNRQDIFFVDDDRRAYLEMLREHCDRFGVRVLGYCLMANHVHLVVTPRQEDSLAKAIGRTHFRYTQYINRLHGRSGHMWQNRFFSCTMDEVHCWRAMVYVEKNPVRAGLVRRPWQYPWSSAAAHVGGDDPAGLLDMSNWRREWSSAKWKAALLESQDEAEVACLRRCTHRGRPLASDKQVSKLERRLGRRLRALPVGRPKKRRGQRAKRTGLRDK